ncbi:MAG: diphosphomevalonate decarboxylase [Pisciglobus halotolerans]|nr:diphosphomevalonate decarboxylase [Atopostipes sp.]MDN6626553.1 diphosphomevalonate decarboxylase [Pisciglobus halotolerans]MDN6731578.1 diphosphomevalonate decarboxylase [Atopostipes suicloacalis]
MSKQSPKWIRAYTNIALIKYWGKADEALKIPMNNSLSLTLDAFFTDTKVTFDPHLENDELYIDGKLEGNQSLEKAQIILDCVRQLAEINSPAKIESINHVPTAAGLASSASGLAALAGAASLSAGLNLSKKELSRLARKGSGSASRSIYPGFAEWQKGKEDTDSYALPIDDANWDLAMLFIIVDDKQKDISSTEGMRRVVKTSPYYEGWLESTTRDLKEIKKAIAKKDFEQLGEIAESSAMKMHALNLSAQPPFNYWAPASITAMRKVEELRKSGFAAYFTMDAGPNVKIICKKSEIDAIHNILLKEYRADQLVKAYPGPGIQVINKND